MSKKLLKNLHLINPCSEPAFVENAFVAISGDTIESAGSTLPAGEFDEVHDLGGKIALPGMINAHHHLYSSLAIGMPLPKKNPANFVEKLKAGTTTVIDHHCSPSYIEGSLSLLADTGERMGINISLAFEISDRNGEEKFDASLNENLDALEKYSGSHYVHPTVGMHASFTLSDDSLKKIHDAVSALESWGIHIHVSEDMADELDAADRGYGSVLERLNQFDLINRNSLIIHGLHIKETDVNLIGEHNAMFVHNPSSNANNRVRMTPNLNLDELDSGLGTDGMQANMLREGKEGMLIRSSNLPGGAASSDYMQLLFGNNPEIASKLFGRKIGRILQGYQADLAIYDYSPRTPITESTIFGHVFFGLSELPSDVITRGEFRIKDRHLLMHSEKEIKANAVTQAEKLWSHF